MIVPTLDVVGVGNAIVDVLTHAEDPFLDENGLTKGAMTLIDAARAEDLYARLPDTVECSGGSAANTMVGIASLGGRRIIKEKVRDDRLGRVFAEDIRAAGVRFDTPPSADGPPTARCLVLVTPDAQRTMQTFLGASATLRPGDIDEDLVSTAKVTYLEGYLWDPPPAKQAFLRAAALAHGAGRKVALSLSDSFCVERHRDELLGFIESHVDIVFANAEEVVALHRADDFDAAAAATGDLCEVAVVTRGAQGSVILAGPQRTVVEAATLDGVVDTTGAGDLYAAGFLHGMTRGRTVEECGRLGAVAAAEIISHFGARPRVPLDRLVSDRGLG